MYPTIDLVRVGIGVVVAFLLCTLRLRLVLWTDAVFSLIAGGLSAYYSRSYLKQSCVKDMKVDAQHIFLVGTQTALLLMPAFTWLYCRTTVDITCRTAITLSRLVMYTGVAITMGVEHYRTDMFTYFQLLYGMGPCILWALIMLVQLVRTGSRVNIHIRRVGINRFLALDLSVLLIYALAHIFVPDFLCRLVGLPYTPLHLYLHRINGCMFLGLSVLPWIGQRFRYVEDKHTVFISRLTCSSIWFGGVGFGVWKKMFPLNTGMYACMGQMGFFFFYSIIANILCKSGPLTAAFWVTQRKGVTINNRGGQPAPASSQGF